MSVCLLNQSGIKASQITYIYKTELSKGSSVPSPLLPSDFVRRIAQPSVLPQSLNSAEMLVCNRMFMYVKVGNRSARCCSDLCLYCACVCDSTCETGKSKGDGFVYLWPATFNNSSSTSAAQYDCVSAQTRYPTTVNVLLRIKQAKTRRKCFSPCIGLHFSSST